MLGQMINVHAFSMPDTSAWVWWVGWENNRSYLFSFSTSFGKHCLHLKWIANAVCGNSSAVYLFPWCSDQGPDRNKALEGGKENVDFPVLNFVQGQPRAGSVPRPKILKGLPHPSVLTVTVCVSDYGLSWFNSRCFTKNHKFSLYLYSKQPNVLKFT